MDNFEGGVAVVTGAASGLGRGMAERFAREGMTAVIADNRIDDASSVADAIVAGGARAVAIEVDVTDRGSVIALADRVDELGGATVLVNNAGVLSHTPIGEPVEDGWRWIVDVNLFGVVYGVQTFLPRMLTSGRPGHIVNTASLAGVVGGGGLQQNRITVGDGSPDLGSMYGYMATKHSVVAVSETLARDLSGSPIGVSVLCPSHHQNTFINENSAEFRPEQAGGPMDDAERLATFGRMDAQRDEQYKVKRKERFPEECAARVVEAIRTGQFYVFTHPETRLAVEHRFRQILAGFDDSAAFDDSAFPH
ncbi:MAG TPA: SDR family NAD(P)-dependent oxidoreductase [Acidimicrobiales bacterium]